MTSKTKSPWPVNAMVGYVDMSASGSMAAITNAQVQAYNVVIFGFANADGTVDANQMTAASTLRKLEKPGTLNLISLGGESGIAQLTSATVSNLLNTVKTYGFDGIDLDLEDPSITMAELQPFVTSLQAAVAGQYLLTMAPILAGTSSVPTLNIPAGGISLAPIYSQPGFDAILVQAYNSGTSFTYPLPSKPSSQINEANANIVSAAYDALQKNGNVNAANRIVIGIPANAGGAPTASNLWDVADYTSVPPVISQNLQDIVAGSYGIDPAQFGGLMTWSLNTDAMPEAYPPYEGYQNGPAGYFAANVAPFMQTLAAPAREQAAE